MNAIKFLLISLLALSAQAVKADTTSGYDATGDFNPSFFRYEQKITFVELNECESKSLDDYAKELFFESSKSGSIYNDASIEGLSLYSKKSDKCVVFYKRPKEVVGHDMEILGHEIAHCIYGAYHSSKFFEDKGVSVKDIEKKLDQDLAINLFAKILLDSCEATNDENKNNMLKALLN